MDLIGISLPAELVGRAEALANRTSRTRDEIIASALFLGLRDAERAQSIVDALDDSNTDGSGVSPQKPVRCTYDLGALLDEMSPETFPEVVNFGAPAGNEAEE